MFSGIVAGRGRILEVAAGDADVRLLIGTQGVDLGPVAPGDSIAVNGVCLTATRVEPDAFAVDVSAETLAKTTLGGFERGTEVNLEASLRVGQSIDGHLVYGHVDGVGRVVGLASSGRSTALTIELPAALRRYIAVKGSVTVDGVSLTVNAVDGDRFGVNIIPHTREITVVAGYRQGTPVNIEVDMIARYVERLLSADGGTLSLDTLKRHGFIDKD